MRLEDLMTEEGRAKSMEIARGIVDDEETRRLRSADTDHPV